MVDKDEWDVGGASETLEPEFGAGSKVIQIFQPSLRDWRLTGVAVPALKCRAIVSRSLRDFGGGWGGRWILEWDWLR